MKEQAILRLKVTAGCLQSSCSVQYMYTHGSPEAASLTLTLANRLLPASQFSQNIRSPWRVCQVWSSASFVAIERWTTAQDMTVDYRQESGAD